MDKQGYRNMLQALELNKEQIEGSISIAERFEAYMDGVHDEISPVDTVWAFSQQLIEDGSNSVDNYIALIHYCRFIQNDPMFVALLELVDGGEVDDNLYHRVGERFGTEIRNEIFSGIGVAPYGTPSPGKPAYLHPVIERLEARVGQETCNEFLSASLRDLPDEYFLSEREKFHQVSNMEAYLRQRKDGFVARLEKCQQEGRLFFAQEITNEVLDFVRNDAEMGGGRLEGNIIYETKIPYMTKQYLAETDPTLKRYFACHCPWVREAIKNGDVKLAENWCQCSGGFHKKPFEVIFQQPLKVEVLESVLIGNTRCRFAIHLPEHALEGKGR
jgi:hypothetical protein